jgi:elongation factor G
MKVYEAQNIRNLGLFGHAGSGKTTFAESFLLETGSINRRGSVEERSSVSDYNEIEQERGGSVVATPLFTEFRDLKINIIDTPGYNDYVGEVIAATSVVDNALIFINAQNGIEVGSENAWLYAEKFGVPVVFVINKCDMDQANFDRTVEEIKHRFGHSSSVIQYPTSNGASFNSIVDVLKMKLYHYPAGGGTPEEKPLPDSEKTKAEELRTQLIESIAESDEELMNKYFENGSLDDSEINNGLRNAIINRQIFPIFVASGKNNIGTDQIADFTCNVLPSPKDMPLRKAISGQEIALTAPPSIFIYKLQSEAHLGDMTFFRVMSGSVGAGSDLINEAKNSSERFNQVFVMNGKKRVEVTQLLAGDIGATVKLKNTGISDTLHEKGFELEFPRLSYPNPIVRTAVVPKTKGEEEKVGMGLHAIEAEDPSFKVEHSQELRQIILHGQGELHLSAAKWRLEHRYKVETDFIEPRVPYRETIQKQVKGSYRHKKQSGGAGQFAEVHMMIEPWFEGLAYAEGIPIRGKELIDLDWGGKLEYVNSIVGGVIDQRFLPAILKGVMDKMTFGPLTGCYVRDIRVTIYDGKMHPVDSNEAAFKTAGMMAFKENFVKADPKILEPIYNVEIKVPEDSVGDVMSDLPTRRGIIHGIDTEGRYQIIKARMPLAELDKYSTALRSMSAGRATYKQEFAEYQVVPPNVQQKLIEEYKKRQTEEE